MKVIGHLTATSCQIGPDDTFNSKGGGTEIMISGKFLLLFWVGLVRNMEDQWSFNLQTFLILMRKIFFFFNLMNNLHMFVIVFYF